MCAVFAEHSGPSRKASKEARRHQLIEATIDTLARKGYAQLTLADVAKTAGLSFGIVIRDTALATVFAALNAIFRRHFTASGAVK